ncbi:prepilin-type N-terminal cleavage/methylation domain-containing protein [Paenibacillus sp. JSM ZJ436]|uniref:type IV pilus modification PilV family protein n=1 Tax=Paenibacillus sp. JSM ZJ436 TaxID=3376190 RepID=UPI0037B89C05
MKKAFQKEQGFSLLEVLAAIVILSIISLVLTSYFTNALSYSKSNQNRTVMVNLARNALFYMEKQNFASIKDLLLQEQQSGLSPSIQGSRCSSTQQCAYTGVFLNPEVLPEVLNPVVNNIQYELEIMYQEELHEEMKQGKVPGTEESTEERKVQMAKYLLPLQVKVTGPGGPKGSMVETIVEGYISDEKIR